MKTKSKSFIIDVGSYHVNFQHIGCIFLNYYDEKIFIHYKADEKNFLKISKSKKALSEFEAWLREELKNRGFNYFLITGKNSVIIVPEENFIAVFEPTADSYGGLRLACVDGICHLNLRGNLEVDLCKNEVDNEKSCQCKSNDSAITEIKQAIKNLDKRLEFFVESFNQSSSGSEGKKIELPNMEVDRVITESTNDFLYR